MTDLDPNIQALFRAEIIADDGFTQELTERLQKQKQKRHFIRLLALSVPILIVVYVSVQLGLTDFVSWCLTTPILPLGETWFAWLLSPVNNAGAILIVAFNLLFKKVGRGSLWRVSLAPF